MKKINYALIISMIFLPGCENLLFPVDVGLLRKVVKSIGDDDPEKGFVRNIQKYAIENEDYRHVLYTTDHLQLTLMSLKAGEETGPEVYEDTDSFFRIESGHGACIIDGKKYELKAGYIVMVPAGAAHNITNTDLKRDLKMYTLYAPSYHKDGLVHATKKEADENPAEFDGTTSD